MPPEIFRLGLLYGTLVLIAGIGLSQDESSLGSEPIIDQAVVFEESEGLVAVEAEHFFKQTLHSVRRWEIVHAGSSASHPDGDPPHVEGASHGAYLEVLPDTRRTHADQLIAGQNFSNEPGKLAVLHYKVHIHRPGRYYVWVRAYSTGTEDNGLHVGLDGQWPESGQRLQWCEGKQQWRWESKQRTAQEHCGVPHAIYLDIDEPGPHVVAFSMREDGFEFDRFIMTLDRDFDRPTAMGPSAVVRGGALPEAFTTRTAQVDEAAKSKPATSVLTLTANQLLSSNQGYYLDKGKWLAINPDRNKRAQAKNAFPYVSGKYDVTLEAVGEEDGKATYQFAINDSEVGSFECPLSKQPFEEGKRFQKTWKNVDIGSGDVLRVSSQVASEDGREFSRARIHRLRFRAADEATRLAVAAMQVPAAAPVQSSVGPALMQPRRPDGSGAIRLTGEMKQWHKVTLTLDGPYAHELDNKPNPFTDYALVATFKHGQNVQYQVPGYFAADGQAANSSADSGTQWRVHFTPDRPGTWHYSIRLARGDDVAIGKSGATLEDFSNQGTFEIGATDKTGRDLRASGRLSYVGEHYLQFAGSKKYFLKVGPDAPETLLGYADFDGTVAGKPGKVPLKTWKPHLQDWKPGDPTWKNGKGKGLIGALNYLASKGCNVFSFLPYNAGGDGDNVWPFVARDDKFHYDCSKLDQWSVVFDHATTVGLYLHFKLQENEIDDNRRGHEAEPGNVPESLDGGLLGRERKLYCREIVARFGHALALNWNIGEENTQSPEEQRDMIRYLSEIDPYDNNIVIHTFPDQQDKVYPKLLGKQSLLTGASLQNSWSNAHERTLKWRNASADHGRPWVVCNDEQNPASDGVPPDPGYQGHDGFAEERGKKYSLHDVRKRCLWGTLMAGGAGVEYYFGYKLPQNDLVCQDFRSRDQSWEYGRIALDFFHENEIPFWEMNCQDDLVLGSGNYCFAKPGEVLLVYLPNGGSTELQLVDAAKYELDWFNPREGGPLKRGSGLSGNVAKLNAPDSQDWLAVIRLKK